VLAKKISPLILPVFGLILCLISFRLLWVNEGKTDLITTVKTSLPAEADRVDKTLDGKFVSITGNLSTNDLVADVQFLRPGQYVKLARQVEMYAWTESKKGKRKKSATNDGEIVKNYLYRKMWLAVPPSTKKFKYPQGHLNPSLPYENLSFTATTAKVGSYYIDPQIIEISGMLPLKLTSECMVADKEREISGNYLYLKKSSVKKPAIGDLRVCYTMLGNNSNVTVFGALSGAQLVPYEYEKRKRIYRLFRGYREDALLQFTKESRPDKWGGRLLGLIVMWGGLFILFEHVVTALKNKKRAWQVGQWQKIALTLIIALILGALVKTFHIITANTWLLLGLILVVFYFVFLLINRKRGATLK